MVSICLQLCIPGIPVYPSAFVLSMTLHNTVNVFSLYKSPQCLALVKNPYKHLKPAGEERPSHIVLHSRTNKNKPKLQSELKRKTCNVPVNKWLKLLQRHFCFQFSFCLFNCFYFFRSAPCS